MDIIASGFNCCLEFTGCIPVYITSIISLFGLGGFTPQIAAIVDIIGSIAKMMRCGQ